ncbi:MAG: TetR/AcrR family transcriptional regulator [Chloroflexota bacterium]
MNTTERIQNATIKLVLQYGYDKLTMQDIANEAHIARSTIYTKWRTKEDLFADILQQESLAYLDRWYELVMQDKDGGSFMGIYRNALLAIHENPFLLALYTQNRVVLGGFISEQQFDDLLLQRLVWNTKLLTMMQDIDMIRASVEISTLAAVAVIFREGLLNTQLLKQSSDALAFKPVLDLFLEMFQQFAINDATADNPDAGQQMLAEYITTYKTYFQAQKDKDI